MKVILFSLAWFLPQMVFGQVDSLILGNYVYQGGDCFEGIKLKSDLTFSHEIRCGLYGRGYSGHWSFKKQEFDLWELNLEYDNFIEQNCYSYNEEIVASSNMATLSYFLDFGDILLGDKNIKLTTVFEDKNGNMSVYKLDSVPYIIETSFRAHIVHFLLGGRLMKSYSINSVDFSLIKISAQLCDDYYLNIAKGSIANYDGLYSPSTLFILKNKVLIPFESESSATFLSKSNLDW